MNEYQKILEKEYGKEHSKSLMKWARKTVQASDKPHESTSRAIIQETDNMRRYDGIDRGKMLAVVAVKRQQYGNQLTVNLDEILGVAFAVKDFRELQQEYLIDIFAVAAPYQFCFLR